MDPLLIPALAISFVLNLLLIPLAMRGAKKVKPLVLQVAALEKVQSELGHQIERKWGPKKSKRIAGATLAAIKIAPMGKV